MEKKALRKIIKEAKAMHSVAELTLQSEAVFRAVEQLDEFLAARSVLAYWSLSDEVQTHDFVERWCDKKKIYLPVVKGDNLEIVRYEGRSSLAPEPIFGILEPTSAEKVGIESIDLVIVPGVAFASDGRRLGRGKGYYDRLLTSSAVAKVGVCFDFQLKSNIPTEDYDVRMDLVVARDEIYKR